MRNCTFVDRKVYDILRLYKNAKGRVINVKMFNNLRSISKAELYIFSYSIPLFILESKFQTQSISRLAG